MAVGETYTDPGAGFSALQRAEIAEIKERAHKRHRLPGFSALQRAEIAEIRRHAATARAM